MTERREMQSIFLKDIVDTITIRGVIHTLEIPAQHKGNGPLRNLREFLISQAITSEGRAIRPVISVDYSWNDPAAIVMAVNRQYSDIVSGWIDGMVPEVLHKFEPQVRNWFTQEALDSARELVWNDDTGKVEIHPEAAKKYDITVGPCLDELAQRPPDDKNQGPHTPSTNQKLPPTTNHRNTATSDRSPTQSEGSTYEGYGD